MKLVFQGKKREAENVYSFYFKSQAPLTWQAGQSIRLELETGYLKDERRFTISSAPSEEHITVTTRVSKSSFKQALASLKTGKIVDAYAIEGDFIWREDPQPLLFMARGLGITPFRSMLAERIKQEKPLNATLVYAYKPGSAVFKKEIDEWRRLHPELVVIYLQNQPFTAAWIGKEFPRLTDSTLYISGASRFVSGLYAVLTKDYQVQASNIKLDEFTGL